MTSFSSLKVKKIVCFPEHQPRQFKKSDWALSLHGRKYNHLHNVVALWKAHFLYLWDAVRLVQIEVSHSEGKKNQYKNAAVYWLPDFKFHQSVCHRISVTIHFTGYVPKSFLTQNRLTLPSPYPLSHTGLI